MISDLFDGLICPDCGTSWNIGEGPIPFKRIKEVPVNHGRDYYCECSNCGARFTIVWEREGGYDATRCDSLCA